MGINQLYQHPQYTNSSHLAPPIDLVTKDVQTRTAEPSQGTPGLSQSKTTLVTQVTEVSTPSADPPATTVPQNTEDVELRAQLEHLQAERDEEWPPIGEEPIRLMQPPRFGKQFLTKDSGVMYLNAVARHQGYSVSIKNHKTEDGQTLRIYLRCGLGRPVNSVAKVRKSSTKMTGCLFEISLNYHRKVDRWIVQQDVKSPWKHEHNHPPFDEPHNYSKNRRFSEPILRQIGLLSSAGCSAGQIRRMIKFPAGSDPLVRDIHNAVYRQKTSWLNGRTPIQGLFDLIVENQWAYRTTTARDGTLQSLFMASPGGIQLARRFPTVIGLDCTYKTNRFNLPLLHIVGTTNTHKTFTVALCFMHSEVKSAYVWALEQL